jgi:hypothetical protein
MGGEQVSDLEEAAWKLYCDETKGDMHVADFWTELPPKVQAEYLKRALSTTDMTGGAT